MKTILCLLVLMMSITSSAQFKYGVKAGGQITTLRVNYSGTTTKSKAGIFLGGYANFRFSDDFAFQPELIYSQQGAEFHYSATHNPYFEEGKINLHYMNLPLMMKWYMYKGLNLEFGLQIGFSVGGKQKGTIWTYDYETEIEESRPFERKIKNHSDFGLNAGIGYEMMNNGLNLGVRYNYGTQTTGGVSGKNSVLSFGVGYSF